MESTMGHEIVDLERRFWVEVAGDFYRAHMAEDGVMVFPETGTLGKPQTIAAIESVDPWEKASLSDIRVIDLDDATRAVVYQASGNRPGTPPHRTLASSVYVRRDNLTHSFINHTSLLGAG
jgi:hypothetical protein